MLRRRFRAGAFRRGWFVSRAFDVRQERGEQTEQGKAQGFYFFFLSAATNSRFASLANTAINLKSRRARPICGHNASVSLESRSASEFRFRARRHSTFKFCAERIRSSES